MGRRFFQRGKGMEREIKCYICWKIRHMSWNHLENKSTNQRGAHIAKGKDEIEKNEVKE